MVPSVGGEVVLWLRLFRARRPGRWLVDVRREGAVPGADPLPTQRGA